MTFIKKNFYTLLIIPYVVGAIGISIPSIRSFFLSLSPIMLLFSFSLIVFEESKWLKKNIPALIVAALGGFIVEYIGVNYSLLFGEYKYGTALGYKLFNVPLIISINWLMLSIASRSLANMVTNNKWLLSLIAAFLMTSYDVLLEPIAIKFDWWIWSGGEVPIFNYVCWFAFSFLFQLVFRITPKVTGRSYMVLLVQVCFYFILLLI